MVFWKRIQKMNKRQAAVLDKSNHSPGRLHPHQPPRKKTRGTGFSGLSQGPPNMPSWQEVGVVDYPADLVILAMGFTGPDKVGLLNMEGLETMTDKPRVTYTLPVYRVIKTILYLLYIVILLMKLIPILLEPNMPVCYAKKFHTFPTHPCLLSRGLYCRSIQLPSQDRLDMPAPLFPNTMKSNAVKQKGCRISLHFFSTTKYLKTLPTLISCIGSMNIFVGASNIPRSKIWRPGHWSTEPVVPWSELQLQGTPLLKMANFSKRSLVATKIKHLCWGLGGIQFWVTLTQTTSAMWMCERQQRLWWFWQRGQGFYSPMIGMIMEHCKTSKGFWHCSIMVSLDSNWIMTLALQWRWTPHGHGTCTVVVCIYEDI